MIRVEYCAYLIASVFQSSKTVRTNSFSYKEVDVRLNNIYRGREFSYQDLKKINIGEIVKEYKVLFIVLEM